MILHKQTERQKQFYEGCQRLGIDADRRYFWYHSIDIGNNLITPGVFDFRLHLEHYHFPNDMTGLKVLDVGAATGFFTFEFAKRGASVTATELPSLAELDLFPGQTLTNLRFKAEKYLSGYVYQKPNNPDIEMIHHLMLDAPFLFCQKKLGLNVQRKWVSVNNFSEETLGMSGFDCVFIGDVLLHTIDPLKALANVAKMCTDTLIIAQHIPDSEIKQPLMFYTGGDDPEDDNSAWWRPNLAWFVQVLRKLGFKTVDVVGEFMDEYLPNGHSENKIIIHAKR